MSFNRILIGKIRFLSSKFHAESFKISNVEFQRSSSSKPTANDEFEATNRMTRVDNFDSDRFLQSNVSFRRPHKERSVRSYDVAFSKYFDIREQLEKGVVNVSPKILAALPLVAVQVCNETHFVNFCLSNWWLSLKPAITGSSNLKLTDTFYGLSKMDALTKGGVVQTTGFESVEILANAIFQYEQIDYFSTRRLAMMFTSLVRFLRNTENVYSTKLLFAAKRCLLLHFSADSLNVHETSQNVGDLLFSALKLGIGQPSNDTAGHRLVAACFYIFNSGSDFPNSYKYYMNLNKIIDVFLKWHFDPIVYEKLFWTRYFATFEYSYSHLGRNMKNQFRALTLLKYLQVAVVFDQEDSYQRVQHFWLEHFLLNVEFLRSSEVKPIYDKIRQKLTNGGLLTEFANSAYPRQILSSLERIIESV